MSLEKSRNKKGRSERPEGIAGFRIWREVIVVAIYPEVPTVRRAISGEMNDIVLAATPSPKADLKGDEIEKEVAT